MLLSDVKRSLLLWLHDKILHLSQQKRKYKVKWFGFFFIGVYIGLKWNITRRIGGTKFISECSKIFHPFIALS